MTHLIQAAQTLCSHDYDVPREEAERYCVAELRLMTRSPADADKAKLYARFGCEDGHWGVCRLAQEWGVTYDPAKAEAGAARLRAEAGQRAATDAYWDAQRAERERRENAALAAEASQSNGSGAGVGGCDGCGASCSILSGSCSSGNQGSCYQAAACLCQCQLVNGGCGSSTNALTQCVTQNNASAQRLGSIAIGIDPTPPPPPAGTGSAPPPTNSPTTGTPPTNSLPTCGPGTILCDDKCVPWSNGSVRPAC